MFFVTLVFALFFYTNCIFAGDPHHLRKDWYDEKKAGVPKEEITSLIITNDKTVYEDLPYWKLDNRGLVAFIRDGSQVVICFPEDDMLKLERDAEACFSFCKYVKNEDYELDENDERRHHVIPEDEIDNEFYDTDLISKLEYIEGLELLNTKETTNMSRLFYGNLNLGEIDLSFMNTSNVENMQHMFDCCASLVNIDVSTLDVSSVTKMNAMFRKCKQLRSIDFSSWDVKNVYDMAFMMSGCENLRTINWGTFNTQSVTSMAYMFQNCKRLPSLDLSFLNTNRLDSVRYMLKGCEDLKSLAISSRIGKFGRSLKLSGVWKNIFDNKVYNMDTDEDSVFNTGLYIKLN